MPTADYIVSVIAPLQDDADIVEPFVADICRVLKEHYAHYELVLVDDGSEDGTADRAAALLSRHASIRLIRLSKTFGKEIAISAGLDSAIGDFVVVMLPEIDPPDLVPAMVERARDGAGIVFGIRKTRAPEGWIMRTGVRAFYWYCNHILKLKVPPNTTDFRVLSRQAVNALTQIKDRSRFLRTLSAYVGYVNQGFEYDPICRRAKPRRKSLREAAELAVNIVVANSTWPLRAVSLIGFLAASVNLLYMFYVLVVYAVQEHVAEGWVTQSMQVSGGFFLVFLVLTVLCEYVGRLLDEVKSRPLYYLVEEQNSSVLIVNEDDRNVVSESVSKK